MNELKNIIAVHIQKLQKASTVLNASFIRCEPFITNNVITSIEEEFVESFTARFNRLADMYFQSTLKLIDEVDFETEGSFKDRLNRADKKGLITNVTSLLNIRILRNKIVHDYLPSSLQYLFTESHKHSPQLLKEVNNAIIYLQNNLQYNSYLNNV